MPIPQDGKRLIKKAETLETEIADGLLDGLSSVEKAMFEMLVNELDSMAAGPTGIKMTAANQAKLTALKAKLKRFIKKSPYAKNVSVYLRDFKKIEAIAVEKHLAISGLEAQKKWFDGLNLTAKENINALLTESGLSANVIDPLVKKFGELIVTGGTRADIIDAIRTATVGAEGKAGRLSSYVGQIATDGVNQYHGAIDEIIGTKFKLNWGVYTGSIIETSRPQCERWTKKTYIHRSELKKEIAWANSNGSGMIPGTNESNFSINRAGFRCRHAFTWVSDNIVPKEIKEKISD